MSSNVGSGRFAMRPVNSDVAPDDHHQFMCNHPKGRFAHYLPRVNGADKLCRDAAR
jgi:hypothetical protein